MLYNESKVCARVKEWRESCNYSQDLVARCIGTTRQTLSEFEQGNPDKLRLGQLLTLCRPSVELDGETIPMMDCEMGYLLGEEGYENRTRAKTDICRATGLSEATINALEKRKEITVDVSVFEYSGYSDEEISSLVEAGYRVEKHRFSLLLDVIEKLSTSEYGDRIVDMLDVAIDTKIVSAYAMRRFEIAQLSGPWNEKTKVSLWDAMNTIEQHGMCLLHGDEAESYYMNEAALAFRKMLEEMIPTEKECLYGKE